MGMDFSGGGVAWGLALGSDLEAGSTGLKDAPLNSAVPYLYVSLGSGDGSAASVSYGGNSASVGSAAGIHLALDPSDPFFYAKVATGTVAGTWAAGYSQRGVIPFTATKSFSLDLGIATADATANFSLRYVNRALTLHVGVEANFVSGVKGFDIHGHLSLDMNLTTNFHGVNIEGRAHVTGGVKVFGVTKDFDIADATINNHGFNVKLPFDKRLTVKW